MKLFKYGDVLAIVMPESLRAKTGAKEGDDYLWFEAEPGVFILVEKMRLNDLTRQGVVAALANKLASTQAQAQREAPVVMRASEVTVVQQAQPRATPAKVLREEEGAKNLIQQLDSQGFVVLSNEVDAKEASMWLESDVKAGRVLGIRGFDKKYYIVTRDFYDRLNKKLLKELSEKKEKSITEVSESLKIPLEACIAVLCLMKEEGEVVERKRGLFTLVK